jgi:hypothetical protein
VRFRHPITDERRARAEGWVPGPTTQGPRVTCTRRWSSTTRVGARRRGEDEGQLAATGDVTASRNSLANTVLNYQRYATNRWAVGFPVGRQAPPCAQRLGSPCPLSAARSSRLRRPSSYRSSPSRVRRGHPLGHARAGWQERWPCSGAPIVWMEPGCIRRRSLRSIRLVTR